MNEFAILALVVTPAIVVVMGYVAVRLHEAAGRRQDGGVATNRSSGVETPSQSLPDQHRQLR